MDIEELAVKITGDSSSLQTAMQGASESLKAMGIDVGKLSPLLGAAGLTGIFIAVGKAAAECQKEFAEAEVQQLRFSAAVAASNTITAQGRIRLEELATSFSRLAGEDDDAVLGMEAMLLATGRTTAEIEKMLPAALGLANATGTDLNTALTQINQTFSGTSGRLGRVTPELNDLTKEELANGAAVDILTEKYGELSTALSGSAQTSMANFNTELGNLKENIGQVVEQSLRPLRDALTGLLREMNDPTSGISTFATGFNNAIEIIKQGVLSLVGRGDIIAAFKRAFNIDQEKAETIAALSAMGDKYSDLANVKQNLAKADQAAAKATADAAKKATEEVIKARQEAEAAYRAELTATDVKVQAGLVTEQDAADAKYTANQKLINDLIALGYTGAASSKSIGDKTLAEAIARNDALYTSTRDSVDKRLLAEYELLEQQRDVAAWEAAYLAKKATEAQAYTNLAQVRIAQEAQAKEREDRAEAERQKTLSDQYVSLAEWRNAQESSASAKAVADETARQNVLSALYTTLAAKRVADSLDAIGREAEARAALSNQYISLAQWRLAQIKAAEEKAAAEELAKQQALSGQYVNLAEWRLAQEKAAEDRALTEETTRQKTLTAQYTSLAQWQIAQTRAAAIAKERADQEEAARLADKNRDYQNYARVRAEQEAAASDREKTIAAEAQATISGMYTSYARARLEQNATANQIAEDAFNQLQVSTAKTANQYSMLAKVRSIDEANAKKKTWTSYEAYLDEMREKAKAAEKAANAESVADFKQTFAEIGTTAQTAVSQFTAAGQAFNDLIQSQAQEQIDVINLALAAELEALNTRTQAQLEAAGLAEETTMERLERELAAAIAAGDEELAAEKHNDITRTGILQAAAAEETRITKEAEREKAQIKYNADLAQYRVNKAMAIAQGALAIIQGFAQLGPIAGGIAALVTAGVTAAQIVIMDNNKPVLPALAMGGIAPGGMALVGERGPELVNLPSGSRVYNNTETKNMVGGARTYVFQSPKALSPVEQRREYERLNRKLAFEGSL